MGHLTRFGAHLFNPATWSIGEGAARNGSKSYATCIAIRSNEAWSERLGKRFHLRRERRETLLPQTSSFPPFCTEHESMSTALPFKRWATRPDVMGGGCIGAECGQQVCKGAVYSSGRVKCAHPAMTDSARPFARWPASGVSLRWRVVRRSQP